LIYADAQGLGAMDCRTVATRTASSGAVVCGGKGGKVGACGGKGGGGKGPKMSQEELNSQVHKALSEAVWEAVQTVAELEDTWSPEEMTKRIVRYLYKSSTAADLTALPWKQAAQQFIEKAAQSYNSACHEKAWFGELDIAPAMGQACAVVADACGGFPRPSSEQVAELAMGWYKDRLEKTKVEKVLWEWIQTNFPADDKIQGKLYKALNNSYTKAYDSARGKSAQGNVEKFMKSWIRDSMGRVWEIPDREVLLTVDTVTELFTGLATPGISGDDDPDFSCVPTALSLGESVSLDFIREYVEKMVDEWENPPEPAAKKAKNGGAEEDFGEVPEE